MRGDKSNSEERLKIKLSAGNNEVKCYECEDNQCIFEILGNQKDSSNYNDGEKYYKNKTQYSEKINYKSESENFIEGKITVSSIINCEKKEVLEGAKVNLYKINGLSPILVDSKVTDREGKVVFSNIKKGCYRVIEIVDKRYFEKPKYINWNEITINDSNKEEKILIINKIKKFKV